MKLKEFKEKIDLMYEKYGDVDIVIDMRLDDEANISFQDENGNYFYPIDRIKYIMSEDIKDISETYRSDGVNDLVDGICISNY